MRKFHLRLFIAIIAAGTIALVGMPERARSDSYTYSSVRRQIKVGIIVTHSLDLFDPGDSHALGSENPDPHVFYILDSRTDLKPLGLEFVNPHAPPVLTGDIYHRWQVRQKTTAAPDPAFVNGTSESRVFSVGSKVTKNMGAYWEANLDNLSTEDLQSYDLLYMCSHKQDIAFGSELQQKLRRFVDGGGTLWIENCGRMTFSTTSPFLLDIGMSSLYTGGGYGAVAASPNHPLLTYPFVLSTQEIQGLGDKRYGNNFLFDAFNAANPTPAGTVLAPIIWNTQGTNPASPNVPAGNWRPLTVAGQIGAGKLIITMQDCGCQINDYVGGPNCGYGGNSCAVTGENLLAASPQDMKFVYNLATWSASNMTGLQNVRRNGFSPEKVGSVVLDKWTQPTQFGGMNKVGGAVFYKNCVFSVDGDLVLHCYDARPGEDLDGDGNPDEGIPDLIAGAPYDEIWRFPLKSVSGGATGASTPTVIEFYDPAYPGGATGGLANFQQRELVLVTLSDGTVVALRAFPRVDPAVNNKMPYAANTRVEWVCSGYATDYGINTNASLVGNYNSADDLPIPAPAWSEGVVFVGVNTASGGRIIAIDPRNGMSALNPGPSGSGGDTFDLAAVPDVASPALQPAITGTPAVAYVKDNASGAIDRVIYAYSQRVSGGGANVSESIRTFWFGTKGEPLSRLNPTTFASRADKPWFVYDPANPGNGNPLLRQRIWYTFRDPNGTYFSQEFAYDPTPGPASPSQGFYKLQLNNTQMRVLLNPQQTSPLGVVQTDDERNTFYADYTLDWVVNAAKPYKITARTVFTAPDVQNGGTQIGGNPAVSPEDITYYTVKTWRSTPTTLTPPNPAAGILFAVNEQFLRTNLKWAFTMHDGYSITVNGNQVQIPPRLREMEPPTAKTDKTPIVFGSFLQNVQFFGTPAYKDGVVYAVARGADASNNPLSLLCAFRANPQLVLRLPAPVDPGTQIRIRQPNIANSQYVYPPPPRQTPAFVELTQAQYTIDYAAGIVRITASAPPGTVNSFVSTSMPFVVQVGNGPEQLIFGTQTDTGLPGPNPTEVRTIGPLGIDNLLWYATIPAGAFTFNNVPGTTLGYISSSPSIQGDNIWLGFQSGYIGSIAADPVKRNPNFQANGSQVFIDGSSSTTLPNLSLISPFTLVAAGLPAPAVISPPVSNANMLFVNTFNGIRVLEDTFTIVADNKRLVEVNAGGEAVWSSDSSRTFGVQGGALPQYIFDPSTGNVIIGNSNAATGAATAKNVQYSHPTVARRIGLNDLLVVDTGNNRVIQIDRGGNVVWEVSRLFDNYRGALRPGDPTTLNEPTDVQFWQDFNPNLSIAANVGGVVYGYTGPAYIVHYLISDTGNFRVVELVDVYDLQGQPVVPTNGGNAAPFAMLRQVNFISSSYGVEGKRYRYRSVQRLVMNNADLPPSWQPNPFDPAQPALPIRQLTLSAISNARLVGVGPVGVNQDDPTAVGQIFQPQSGSGSLVILSEAGNPLSIVSNLRIPTGVASFRSQAIVSPTWFSSFTEAVPGGGIQIKYLLADDNGCYQMVPGKDAMTGQDVMNVEWLITTDDYYRITGKRLKPGSIRRLVSAAISGPGAGLHHFLISNRFSGEDNPSIFGVTYNTTMNALNGNIAGPTEFHGEVFELDPTNFNIALPGHGYLPDYITVGNYLTKSTNASIVWRSPTESVPGAGTQVGFISRFIGDSTRATSTAVLEQPAYADRPF